MKPILEYLSTKVAKPSIIKATNENIYKIVKDELDRLGHDADLNHIDVSEVTIMYNLFSCMNDGLGSYYIDLNPDITRWDVSNVEDMRWMFYICENFNQDLSKWDVSKVESMSSMFSGCRNFNQDLSGWDVSKVTNMEHMFRKCKSFNQDLSQWDVNNVIYNIGIFFDCPIRDEYKPKFN